MTIFRQVHEHGPLYRTRKVPKGVRYFHKRFRLIIGTMSIGQWTHFITTHKEELGRLLKDVRFEAIHQPLYTTERLAEWGRP